MRKFLWTLFLVGMTCLSVGVGILTIVVWQVQFGDISQLKKTTILSKIQEETSIYYFMVGASQIQPGHP